MRRGKSKYRSALDRLYCGHLTRRTRWGACHSFIQTHKPSSKSLYLQQSHDQIVGFLLIGPLMQQVWELATPLRPTSRGHVHHFVDFLAVKKPINGRL